MVEGLPLVILASVVAASTVTVGVAACA